MIGKIVRDKRLALHKAWKARQRTAGKQSAKEERKYTLKAVGESIGVSESYICNIERDKQTASPRLIRKLANYLDIDADYLLGAAGFMTAEMTEAVAKSPDLFDALDILCAFGPSNKTIYQVIAQLKDIRPDDLKKLLPPE